MKKVTLFQYSEEYLMREINHNTSRQLTQGHFFHQELPKRLLLTYKPEESEDIPEPASVEEENAPVEEPVLVPPVTEVVSPPKTEVADTGDLLVGKLTC